MSTTKTNEQTNADIQAVDELFAAFGKDKSILAKNAPKTPDYKVVPGYQPIDHNPVVYDRHGHAAERIQADGNDIDEQRSWQDWIGPVFLVGGLLLAAFFFVKGMPNSPLRGSTVNASATKQVVQYKQRMIRIADADVGMRALGRNPLRDQVETAPEPDPKTWRKLVITMGKESGHKLHIKLLRSLAWIEAVGAKAGGTFHLDLPEMGAVGDARVEAILPCPPIEKGRGNVVTGTFAHEADPDTKILSVTFANGAHIKGVTDNHPFYSVDQNAFVPVGEMREGDSVKINGGTTRITKLTSRFAYPGEMLYNLETHNQHVYQVTTAGILVHNSCAEIAGNIARKFGTFECKQCASAIVDSLKAKGIRGHLIKLKAPNAHRGFIVSDRLGGKLISETGEHWGVRVGGKVYDNLNPNGVF